MQHVGSSAPAGALGNVRVSKRAWPAPLRLRDIARHGFPSPRALFCLLALWVWLPAGERLQARWACDLEVARWRTRNLPHLWRGLWRLLLARAAKRISHVPLLEGALWLDVHRGDGRVVRLGLASLRLVTNNGAGYLVDALQNLTEAENMKFHGWGTGSTAEAAGDTALVTELTTEYQTDNTRVTGSQTEASAQVYRTVATLDPDADVNLREHGVFSASSAGTLLDRSVFASVNLVGAAGDTLQSTYDFTINSGN